MANKEVQDLIEMAQFSAKERVDFLAGIHKGLKSKNIFLDSLA